jgi:hypothetical protein
MKAIASRAILLVLLQLLQQHPAVVSASGFNHGFAAPFGGSAQQHRRRSSVAFQSTGRV